MEKRGRAMVSSVEIFAGGGGLLLGGALAGVKHIGAVEWNHWACETMRVNSSDSNSVISGLPVFESDVRAVDWTTALGNSYEVDIVSGGPPCQPFSLGGLARSADDPRDMFPAMAEVISVLKPKAFVVENVKGLTRKSFTDYLEFIKLRLTFPEIHSRPGELWREHYVRLQKESTASTYSGLSYNLVAKVVDAADYGVPQRRHRIFIVGFRSDLGIEWSPPEATHSANALSYSQHRGDYWERHKVSEKLRFPIKKIALEDGLLPWQTVRDALHDLPEPKPEGTHLWLNHKLQLGAKIYPGHTGSPLDEPSKALKAGNHGVPGGENMIRFPEGHVRYYSVREAARIQTFPDDYALHGAWGEAMRQLGNAVPVKLAEVVMSSVREQLVAVSRNVKQPKTK